MTGFEFGDVVLVRFPFSDHGTVKQRPAAVISSAAYHQVRPDVLIMAISSQIRPWSPFAEAEIRHWKSAGLLKPSVLKPVVATIERSLIRRTLVIFVRLISTRCAPS